MSLPSSMAGFVPCDRLLQKAYYVCFGDCIGKGTLSDAYHEEYACH